MKKVSFFATKFTVSVRFSLLPRGDKLMLANHSCHLLLFYTMRWGRHDLATDTVEEVQMRWDEFYVIVFMKAVVSHLWNLLPS